MTHYHPTRWLLSLLLSAMLYGQSFDATAGGFQIYNAYGLKTDYKLRNLSGWSGVGYSDNGMRLGGYLQMPILHPLSPGESTGGIMLASVTRCCLVTLM
jgi:hypothetical protein